MKTIKILLFLAALFIGTISFAQSHNTTVGSSCKYAKNRCTNMEGCPQCAACNADDKKEKEAKVAEVKKRNEKIWADAKAKKDAEQKAYQDKIAADEKKRKSESGEVLINAQPASKTINNTSSVDGKTIVVSKKNFSTSTLYSKHSYNNKEDWTFIVDKVGDTILKSTEFSAWDWDKSSSSAIYLNSSAKNPPFNAVVVKFNSNGAYNLINSKGEKLLEEDNIVNIKYCGNNFFMYAIGDLNNPESFDHDSYNLIGEKVILYDFELKKKYYFNKIGGNENCPVNNRVQIKRESDLENTDSLFAFAHFICTHKLKNVGGYMITDDENFKIGIDRKLVMVGITHSLMYPHE